MAEQDEKTEAKRQLGAAAEAIQNAALQRQPTGSVASSEME